MQDKDLTQQNRQLKQSSPASSEKPKKTKSGKRMTIEISEDLAESLERLSEQQGFSQADVIRRAIATEVFFAKEIQDGGKILIQKDDSIREIVFR